MVLVGIEFNEWAELLDSLSKYVMSASYDDAIAYSICCTSVLTNLLASWIYPVWFEDPNIFVMVFEVLLFHALLMLKAWTFSIFLNRCKAYHCLILTVFFGKTSFILNVRLFCHASKILVSLMPDYNYTKLHNFVQM